MLFIAGMFVGAAITIVTVLWIDRKGIQLPW